ncbi:unnamed protein product [Linum trigynum]|uniref:Uncharacterized protein n=1 Tax=Linum trigynum TaxID=586398 RepID=A0AAV2F9G9_9ROSI
MEAPLLAGEDGDYAAVKTWPKLQLVFWTETQKPWKIAEPIAFNTECQFRLNSVTVMFVGHSGDVELFGVSISLSVIDSFVFGFRERERERERDFY